MATCAEGHTGLRTAIADIGTRRRWTTVGGGPSSVQVSYAKGPNWVIALILLLFFVAPWIVYLVLAGKRENLSIDVSQAADATTVQVTSNGIRGKQIGRRLRRRFEAHPVPHVV